MTRDDPNPNTQNLRHLAERSYAAIHIVTQDGSPVAVAAIEAYPSSGEPVFRVLTRSWYHPSVRNRAFWTRVSAGPVVRILLPHQIAWCERQGARAVFVSMETLRKRAVLSSWVKSVNRAWPEQQWKLAPNMHFTCKVEQAKRLASCWQNVAVLHLRPTQLPLPLDEITTDEFRSRFTDV